MVPLPVKFNMEITRYQVFCRFCTKTIERDTTEQALKAVHDHEVEYHQNKLNPPRASMDDFYPHQYRHFDPASNNAERCPVCKQLGMTPFQPSSTARQCANPECHYLEERSI